ncbi:hypothetical protein BTO06_16135 [Tenacibaculum sp. SZ-18]|uniref:hypothetical protein n=1 Tax=Tenacibaculum sp. SZ-18 TaxID=754423 RepID=UPI000C2D3F38|nr:hypothetical protein [Tenacibaculum sp. SZ-18]AUC16582.1 hypothetical protein BTO06_16135 [Tenacibaculum sp. SZ-18]
MKKLFLLLAITVSTSIFANNSRPAEVVKSEIRTEIIKLLGNANFNVESNLTADVEFMINNKGEVIVLTVDTKNADVETYVKNKLNYKLITNKLIVKGQTYKMPLKLVKA